MEEGSVRLHPDLYINIFEGVEGSEDPNVLHKFVMDYTSFKLETNPRKYFRKWLGKKFSGSPPLVNLYYILWSFIGSFAGIAALAITHQYWLSLADKPLLIGSFGASAVLLYAAPNSPLAQPRNFVGGHILSALVGVVCFYAIQSDYLFWLRCSLAVALSITVMNFTKTLHPPAAATSLIFVSSTQYFESLGILYVIVPVAFGCAIMLLVTLIFVNVPKSRTYPEYWW